MPRCYMVKKGLQRHEGPPPCSPTEASVAPPCYSPAEHSALTETRAENGSAAFPESGTVAIPETGVVADPETSVVAVPETGAGAMPEAGVGALPEAGAAAGTGAGQYAELGRGVFSERSAADTEAAHELLSLAQSVPPLPPAVVTVIEPLPLYTYTIQPTNIYILAEEPPEPVYTTVQTVPAIEYVEPQINYVTYQTADETHIQYAEPQYVEEVSEYVVQEITEEIVEPPPPPPPPPPLTPAPKKPAKYDCNECGKRYATSSNLSRHKQTHRSLDSQSAKRCNECGKAYVSMPALAMHVLTHRMGHVCGVCGKQFSRPWLLRGHLRSHTGEKPYSCAECGKAFADRSNLRAHLQTHSGDKKYECERCRKSFALKSYLNKHQEATCVRVEDGE